jgi:ABC-type multidrug transport system fused ATPase/permease subunit
MAAQLAHAYSLNQQKLFTGCYVVFVGSVGSGVSMGQMPSISRAKQAAKFIFGMIEEKSKIDPDQKGLPFSINEGIEFKNVMFRYPSRQKFVLRNFNLKIEPN